MLNLPKIRSMSIVPVHGGYLVGVGCQSFVFTGVDDLVSELSKYLHDPEGQEKLYTYSEPEPDMPLEASPRVMSAASTAITGYSNRANDIARDRLR